MNGKFSDFLRHRRKISPAAAIFARFALQFTPIKTIGTHQGPGSEAQKINCSFGGTIENRLLFSRYGSLLMVIRLSAQNSHGAVDLLGEEKAHHLVGECHLRQTEKTVGP